MVSNVTISLFLFKKIFMLVVVPLTLFGSAFKGSCVLDFSRIVHFGRYIKKASVEPAVIAFAHWF